MVYFSIKRPSSGSGSGPGLCSSLGIIIPGENHPLSASFLIYGSAFNRSVNSRIISVDCMM